MSKKTFSQEYLNKVESTITLVLEGVVRPDSDLSQEFSDDKWDDTLGKYVPNPEGTKWKQASIHITKISRVEGFKGHSSQGERISLDDEGLIKMYSKEYIGKTLAGRFKAEKDLDKKIEELRKSAGRVFIFRHVINYKGKKADGSQMVGSYSYLGLSASQVDENYAASNKLNQDVAAYLREYKDDQDVSS